MKKPQDDRKQIDAERRDYFGSLPANVRTRMKQVREIVRAIAPDATEVLADLHL